MLDYIMSICGLEDYYNGTEQSYLIWRDITAFKQIWGCSLLYSTYLGLPGTRVSRHLELAKTIITKHYLQSNYNVAKGYWAYNSTTYFVPKSDWVFLSLFNLFFSHTNMKNKNKLNTIVTFFLNWNIKFY